MNYLNIVNHYEDCFKQYGDSPKGVDWTKEEQVATRYQVMLEIINFREKNFSYFDKIDLLDYGCGLSHLYEYILKNELKHINYFGLEISEKFFQASKQKYPNNTYFLLDILKNNTLKRTFDYIVMNGVFTEKRELSYHDMFDYFKKMMTNTYALCKRGLAFNLMSKQVAWEKDFLFHVPLDDLAFFLTKELTRNFIIRNDYGLYEYTVYIYK